MFGYINCQSVGLYNHDTSVNLNHKGYCDVCEKWLIPALKADGILHSHTLMQDGALSHTCVATQKFLAENEVNVLPFWPAYSPDLNIIENLWSYMKRDLKIKYRKEGLPKNQHSFYTDAYKVFHKLCNQHVKKLFNCIKGRLRKVIKYKGERLPC